VNPRVVIDHGQAQSLLDVVSRLRPSLAGHSVDVLLRVYAKCIAGQEDAVRRRVEEALGAGRDQDRSVHGP
jgi:hypothetical protein